MRYEYSSIGYNCIPAMILKKHKLKVASYPFDWMITQARSLPGVLDDKFAHYIQRENLIKSKENLLEYNTYYSNAEDICFVHRYPLSVDADFDYYIRCIERFKCISNDDVTFFVRLDCICEEQTSIDAMNLDDRYKAIYESLVKFGLTNFFVYFFAIIEYEEDILKDESICEPFYKIVKIYSREIEAIKHGYIPESLEKQILRELNCST